MAIHLQNFWYVESVFVVEPIDIPLSFRPFLSPVRLHLQTIETQQMTRVRPDKKLMSQPTTNLRFHEHKINKQYHEIMFNIFIRKPLAPGTLCQSHISTTSSLLPTATFGNCPVNIRKFRISRPGADVNSFGADSRKCRRSRGVGPSITGVATMRDVVELGDGIVAFDTDWHLSPRLTDEYIRWRNGRQNFVSITPLCTNRV